MSSESLKTRLGGVRAALPEKEIDALLLTDINNVGYVTGFTGSLAYALVSPDEALILTDPRYTLRAKQECPWFTLIQADGSGGYPEALKAALEARPHWKKIGFEASRLTVAQHEKFQADIPSVQWVSTSGIVETLRLVKDAEEIAAIRAAITVAEDAFLEIKPLLKAGAVEREIALHLEFAMRRRGAQGVAFPSIVASGPLGARPHHSAGDRAFQPGDFVTLDWGASLNGYHSDITRTVLVAGQPVTDKQRDVYEAVLESQRRAIAAIAPGRNGKEIDAIARDYLAERGYGEAFRHSLGHSLGRETHDGAGLSVRSEAHVLKPGMVLTVEPGVYLEDWGGVRIEEDVVVTDTGCAVLTHLPNALEVVG